MNDLKFAIRQLFKQPGFAAVAAITLALGIGANTAMFSFLNSLLLRRLPFPNADQLVKVQRVTPQDSSGKISPGDFKLLRHEAGKFGHFAAYEHSNATVEDFDRPTRWVRITTDTFDILGVHPELGRNFRSEEEIPGNERVALISHWIWLDRFGGTSDVLGKSLHSAGTTFQIIGVMPPAATDHRLFDQVGIFTPLMLDGTDSASHRLDVLGRRAPNISAAQADSFISNFGARLANDFPSLNKGTNWRSERLPESTISPTGKIILCMLLGLSGFVLLIACSNLANFLLARTIERTRELAVRAALGASRIRILRPLAIESLTLAILGGTGAIFVSQWTTNWLRHVIGENGGPTFDFSTDWHVLAFALSVSIITILFFGIGPALMTLRVNANDALKSGARGGTPGRTQKRATQALIIGQFSLAMVLLAGAGFFVRGAANMLQQDYGWNSKNLVQCRVVLPTDTYPDGPRIAAFHKQLLDRISHTKGVESACTSFDLPFLGFRASTPYTVEGHDVTRGQEPTVFINDISTDYFNVTKTRLLSGRAFNSGDNVNSPKVAIINETMARTFFPNKNPIGRRIAPAGPSTPDWVEIVGVAADARSIDVADKPLTYQVYKPSSQNPARSFIFLARVGGASEQSMLNVLRDAVTAIDPGIEVHELMTTEQMIQRMTSQMSMVRQLLIAFAGLGLFLVIVGIYGMLARLVAQRSTEIGIRMALGAQIRDVVGLILKFGIHIAVAGAGIGLLGCLGLARLISAALPTMKTDQGFVLFGSTLALVAVAIGSSWLPARRAGRVDPMQAIRTE